MSICQKGHRYVVAFQDLPLSQASDGRHKCAGCAYEEGFSDGLNNAPHNYDNITNSLPYSQAGTVRHRETKAAYDLGYSDGQNKNKGA